MPELIVNQEFGVFYAISQFFALAALIFNLVAVQRKKKVKLLFFDTLAASCMALHYLFLGAWTGVATKVISATRDGIATYKANKHQTSKILPIIFVLMYVVIGFFTYQSPFSLLPILAPITFTMMIYLGDAQMIRWGGWIGSVMWLIYDIHVFSVVGIASEAIYITNDLVAIWRYRGKKKRVRGSKGAKGANPTTRNAKKKVCTRKK